MSFLRNIVALVTISSISTYSFSFGTGNIPTPPAGWKVKEIYTNFLLYQKTGESTYMQIVDIKGGAKIKILNPGKTYGPWGNYPKFSIYDLESISKGASTAKSFVNGQFFAYRKLPNPFQIDPTTLSFGIRSNGQLLTQGEDKNSYPSTSMRQVEITDGIGVSIYPWDENRLNGLSKAQNIIVGLDPRPSVVSNKDPNSSIGRMLICSKPFSGAPWLYILSAKSLTQQNALNYAINWGCTNTSTIMMDGSGSAQLKTSQSGTLLSGDRKIPQAIAIYNK